MKPVEELPNLHRFDLAERGRQESLWDWDLATDRIRYSRRWIAMLGCQDHEIGNSPQEWFTRVHPEDLPRVRREIEKHLAGDELRFEIQHRMLHKDRMYRWFCCRGLATRDETGRAVRLSGSHLDITAEKVTDPLTGLPNRILLLNRLSRALDRGQREQDFLFALLLVNLDRFRTVTEQVGTAGADRLLTAVARRLEAFLRAGDTTTHAGRDHVVARLRGDEFAVLLEGLESLNETTSVAEGLLREISIPLKIDGREIFLSASMGVALSATAYRRPEEVLRDADVAMYRAKSLGKARFEFFDTAVLKELQLDSDLQSALERREFSLHYQPIVSLATNRLEGFEALLRWNHPTRGSVSPTEFIPIAERTGFINLLGEWVIGEAGRQLEEWSALPEADGIWISVNVSIVQLMQPDLVERIARLIGETGLDPHRLVLEVTESGVMENPASICDRLMQLRVMGIRIGLDDFGTGYSSLSHLRQIPADCLKIDRSFVQRLGRGRDNSSIAGSIAGLAHQLGLRVIAEGIETAEQLEGVRAFRCEYGQGFLFSKPLSAPEAAELLEAGLPLAPQEEKSGFEAVGAMQRMRGRLAPATAAASHFAACLAEKIPARKAAPVLVALAALVLTGGFAVLLNRAIPAPPPPIEFPAHPPGFTEPLMIPETLSRTQETVVAAPARPEAPAASYPVIHDHVFGNCKGVLKIDRDGIAFVSEEGKDSFRSGYPEFSCSLSGNQLIIETDSRTYRFKSAAARSDEENKSTILKMIESISRFRQKAGAVRK